MKKWLPIAILFVLAVFAIWFWSLGRLPKPIPAQARVDALVGQVEYQEPGQTTWTAISNNQVVTNGSTLRTGASSTATITWFDRGQTRLSENTELKIVTATQAEAGTTNLQLGLEHGRIWSRILRLLDLESDVQARTDDIVATVRGTAFDIEKISATDNSTVWVSDSVVQVTSPAHDKLNLLIPQGAMAKVGTKLNPSKPEDIPPTGKVSDWFTMNTQADHAFVQAVRDNLRRKGTDQAPPFGSVGEWLQQRSLALHMTIAGNDRKAIAKQLFERRLLAIRQLFEDGRSGYAAQQFNELERGIKDKNTSVTLSLSNRELATSIKESLPAFDVATPDSPILRIKQRLEDLLLDLSDTQTERLFHRLFGIAERLDESNEAMESGDFKQADVLVGIAQTALDNYARESKSGVEQDAADKIKIDSLEAALRLRSKTIREAISQALAPPLPSPAPILPEAMVTSTAATTSTSPVSTLCKDFHLTLTPATFAVGSSTALKATVVYDSVIEDVTQDTHVEVPNGLVSLSGTRLTALKSGQGELVATYQCDAQAMSARLSITIASNQVNMTSFEVTVTPNQLPFLSRAVIAATAKFDDGGTKDVTKQVRLSLSDPKLGELNGNILSAYQISGSTEVVATYVTDQKTWTARASVTVVNPDAR